MQERWCKYWNMRFASSVDVARIGVLNVTSLFVYKASKSLRLLLSTSDVNKNAA